LSQVERNIVLDHLNSTRFGDKSPAQVYAALLDEGIYLCSISTMYRILRENDQVRERRNILRRPEYKKPELLATEPNQVWSWDITKLKGPAKWNYFYLYVIIDIYSRYVVGWTVALRESAELAKELIKQTYERQNIQRDQLFIHADRGSAMTSKGVALLMTNLGITKSLNRPHVSNDNPYSESHFKTLKYQPKFPARFGSQQDAQEYCREFFDWYNNEHYHSSIALMTPSVVHYGAAGECTMRRNDVLLKKYDSHPERFVSGPPKVSELPAEVWINKPVKTDNNDTICSITIIGEPKPTVL
jgi:putative transposase